MKRTLIACFQLQALIQVTCKWLPFPCSLH